MIILHTKNQKEAFTGALNEEYEEESFIYNDLSMFDLTNIYCIYNRLLLNIL